MSSVIVLLEMEPSTEVLGTGEGVGEVDIGARVRFVHAALAGGLTHSAVPAHTLCGLETTPLEPEAYQPVDSAAPWYPPEYASRRCAECDAAVPGS
jgi:hypothetical protein